MEKYSQRKSVVLPIAIAKPNFAGAWKEAMCIQILLPVGSRMVGLKFQNGFMVVLIQTWVEGRHLPDFESLITDSNGNDADFLSTDFAQRAWDFISHLDYDSCDRSECRLCIAKFSGFAPDPKHNLMYALTHKHDDMVYNIWTTEELRGTTPFRIPGIVAEKPIMIEATLQ